MLFHPAQESRLHAADVAAGPDLFEIVDGSGEIGRIEVAGDRLQEVRVPADDRIGRDGLAGYPVASGGVSAADGVPVADRCSISSAEIFR